MSGSSLHHQVTQRPHSNCEVCWLICPMANDFAACIPVFAHCRWLRGLVPRLDTPMVHPPGLMGGCTAHRVNN
eukprot:10405140-Alexandrium_andersonii.AAC.1